MAMAQSTKLIIVLLVGLVIGAFLGYYYAGETAVSEVPETALPEDVQEAANPFAEVEESANPFKDTYRNPFE